MTASIKEGSKVCFRGVKGDDTFDCVGKLAYTGDSAFIEFYDRKSKVVPAPLLRQPIDLGSLQQLPDGLVYWYLGSVIFPE